MPDFQQFSLVRNGTVSLPAAPNWDISLQVVDSKTGALIRDFTGANMQHFPQILGLLSAAEQDEFVQMSVNWLINKRAGTG